MGTAISIKQLDKLREKLSNISPGLLFDRTDKVLQEQDDSIMTIGKYEEEIAKQSRHIIESNEILKLFLAKIEDLNNQLELQQSKTGDEDDNNGVAA